MAPVTGPGTIKQTMTKLRCAAILATTLLLLSACSSDGNQETVPSPQDLTPTSAPVEIIPSAGVDTETSPAFWADSIRIDGPKIAEFYQDELEQQVNECKPDITALLLELGLDQTGWNFGYVETNLYDEREYGSVQEAWDAKQYKRTINEIFYFSYNFLGPYKGDYRQQIEIMIGAWKPIGGTSQFSDVKEFAISAGRSEYVYQLSPENNFAMVIAYGTDQDAFIAEPIPLGKIDPVETFVKQLVACEIPYWVSS